MNTTGKTKIVTTADIFTRVKTYLETFVHFDNEYQTSIASLYVLMTWVFEEFDYCPYLMISGERGTGKSTLVTAMSKVCNKSRMLDACDSSIVNILEKGRGTTFVDPMLEITKPGTLNEMVQFLQMGVADKGLDTGKKSFVEQYYETFGPKVIVVYDAESFDPYIRSLCLWIQLIPVSWAELSINQAIPSSEQIEEWSCPLKQDLELWGYQFRHRIIDVRRNLDEPLSQLHVGNKLTLPILAIANDVGSKELMGLVLKPPM